MLCLHTCIEEKMGKEGYGVLCPHEHHDTNNSCVVRRGPKIKTKILGHT